MATKLHPTPVTSQSITRNRCVDVEKKKTTQMQEQGRETKQAELGKAHGSALQTFLNLPLILTCFKPASMIIIQPHFELFFNIVAEVKHFDGTVCV